MRTKGSYRKYIRNLIIILASIINVKNVFLSFFLSPSLSLSLFLSGVAFPSEKKEKNEGILQRCHCKLTMKKLYHCSYSVRFLSDRESADKEYIWENTLVFIRGEILLLRDLTFMMQESSELHRQVQVFTCWVRSDWVERTRAPYTSPLTFLVSVKSASCYLLEEHLSLFFKSVPNGSNSETNLCSL